MKQIDWTICIYIILEQYKLIKNSELINILCIQVVQELSRSEEDSKRETYVKQSNYNITRVTINQQSQLNET